MAFLGASVLLVCGFSAQALVEESLPDLLRKLEEFQKNQPPKDSEIKERSDWSWKAMRAFEAAALQADAKTVQQLIAFYKGVNDNEFFFNPLALALSRCRTIR